MRQERTYEDIVRALEERGSRRVGLKWQCPAHDDKDPSLELKPGDSASFIVKCRSQGCSFEAIMRGLGLWNENGKGKGKGKLVKAYDYVGEDGELLHQTVRFEPKGFSQRRPDGNGDWIWSLKGGTRLVIFRLPQVLEAVKAGEPIFVLEGEKDTEAVERAGGVGTCCPMGAEKWKPEYSEYFRGANVTIVADADDAGRKHAREVFAALDGIADELHVVEPATGNDAHDHLAAGKGLDEFVPPRAHLAQAHTLSENGSTKPKTAPQTCAEAVHTPCTPSAQEAFGACEELANAPRILERFVADLNDTGAVGEEATAKLLYLAATSRLLPKIASVAVKGPSSGGKSFTVDSVLAFFPETAYVKLTSGSEKSLYYMDETELVHKMLVILEAGGMEASGNERGEFAMAIRSLLSEGSLWYQVPERVGGKTELRRIQIHGPTGLIVTTTAASLHPENETRIISTTVNDTEAQTKAIFKALVDEDRRSPDLGEWHALQEWLAVAESVVAIPYGNELAAKTEAPAVRMRRDFGQLLRLIRAHAVLHQATRDKSDGPIIATLDDYEATAELIGELVARGVQAKVSPEVRQTVEWVEALTQPDGMEPKSATTGEVARSLGLHRTSALRRLAVAEADGYVVNQNPGDGKQARWVIGDSLPGDFAIFPARKELE